MAGYGHSWHQSHDQTTVLLLVPFDTPTEDVFVQIEQNYLIAGVKDQVPLIKGRVYGPLISESSSWQLEPRIRHHDHERVRTTSTTSIISDASSFAIVSSDPDISSSFAASIASGRQSVTSGDYGQTNPYPHQAQSFNSPAPSPVSHTPLHSQSRPTSPRLANSSWASSMSSRSSLHDHISRAGRLLTIYLEKAEHVIWPSVIVGPVPAHVYPTLPGPPGATDVNAEEKYNMDAVSLGVVGVEHADAGRTEEAFEYFIRAWHQAHTPLSTLRLPSYLPPTGSLHIHIDHIDSDPSPNTNTSAYYLQRLGGLTSLAHLYIEAGHLYLEGVADTYLPTPPSPHRTNSNASDSESIIDPQEKWQQEKEIARRFFERARMLDPHADIPVLAIDPQPPSLLSSSRNSEGEELMKLSMPDLGGAEFDNDKPRRRRRKPEETMIDQVRKPQLDESDADATWYLYLPGLIGAGTALLAVGIIGAMSLGTWRKSQTS